MTISSFLSSITIQVELIWSLVIMALLGVLFVYAGKKIKAADPTARPSGIVLVSEVGVRGIYKYIQSIMPKKFEKNYYPYMALLFVYIFVCNISGLLSIEAPTSNYSIVFTMTFITFVLIQLEAIRKKGVFKYLFGVVIPPTNILSTLSPLISVSFRLFGNILGGSILMSLIYSFTGYLASFIINFNFVGVLIAPAFHAYFDLFAGLIQTLVFVTLSAIFIAIENED